MREEIFVVSFYDQDVLPVSVFFRFITLKNVAYFIQDTAVT